MATSTGPDLTGAVEAIEALMDDECVVTRNEGGTDDAVLDQNTGQLVEGGLVTKYEGRCMVRAPSGLSNRPEEQGGQIYTRGEYMLSLPLTELETNPDAEPQKGDYVLVTSTRRDPALVGKSFRIIDVTYKTMATARRCALEYRG